MTYFPGYHAKVRYNHYSLYFSDGLEWKRLRLNLGLNASYDSFLKNFDTAPRFSFDYDTTGSDAFRLNGGLNRYYGGGILAYALRGGIPPNESRTRINDPARGEGAWQFDRHMNNSQNWQTSRLDTPYSDEANLGFVWRFGNRLLDARYVHRKSRDQFTPEDDENGSHIMTNKGRGNSNHYSFTSENIKPYRAGIWAFGYKAGARYHKYRTNYNGNYEDVLTTDMTQVTDSYNLLGGKRYASLAEMPPFNFNSPWSAFVEIRTDIPKWRFQWTHSLSFRSAYKNYNRHTVAQCRNSSQPEACGDWEGRVNDYRLRDYKQALTLDWRFLWDIPAGKNKLNLSLDVLNVLNKKLSAAGSASKPSGTARSSVSDYETGRQYWFGASYRW